MPGFLEKLKLSPSKGAYKPGSDIEEKEIWFQISFAADGAAYLRTTDRRGNRIQPDYRMYDGILNGILRSIDLIGLDDSFRIRWGTEAKGINLAGHPQILYMLMDYDRILDESLEPVETDRTRLWDLEFSIQSSNDVYESKLCLTCDGNRLDNPRFLNESFALCDRTLVRLNCMIGNFQSIPAFADSFPRPLLEKFLSVLFTNLDSIKVLVDGNPVTELSNPEDTRPTIIIEKVDSDKALHIRMTQEIPGIEYDFLEDFKLTRFASVAANGAIVIRPISQQNITTLQHTLFKNIIKFAPSKADAREVFREGGYFIIPEHTASPFLLNGLSSLIGQFKIVGAEKLNGYKVRPATPKISLKLGSGIDFLEADANLTIGDEQFSLSSFLQQYRKQNYILLADGDKAVIDEAFVRKLERLFSKGKKNKTVVSYFDLPEITRLIEDGSLDGNEGIRRSREFYEGFGGLASAKTDAGGIKARLRPYQESGVKWLNYLYDSGFGACLADDMGLGKTVQTIALLGRIYGRKKRVKTDPALIVMPRSLLFNWASELARFAPSISTATYYGPARNLEEARKSNVILTTYGMVRSDIDELRSHKFNLVILDESQNIKNINAQMTQAVLLLQTDHRVSLSGTPVENNLTELYSLFRFLNPAMFGSLNDFNEKFGMPIANAGDKDALEELRRKIYPFILRRTKSEVLDDLPDRMDQKILVNLDEAHATFYEQRRRSFRESVSAGISKDGLSRSKLLILQALSELRRIASVPECLTEGMVKSSKIPVLTEILEEAVANGHKIVVFFNFIAGIELVSEKLEEDGIGYETLTGSTRDRGGVVSRFQTDPSCKVLLMTLKTGGVGLNLTAADIVFIFEPWWNKAEEEQAIGRLHRIGQKAKVMTYSLIASGTIEDKICQLQEQKKSLVDSLISSDGAVDKQLSAEDIDFLLN